MATHVALLRGINLGGKNKVAMADLRAVVESLGHTDVATYIQSGNVVFTARRKKNTTAMASELERAIALSTGVHCRVVVLSRAELAQVAADSPYPHEPSPQLVHAIFLTEPPGPDVAERVATLESQARDKGGRDEVQLIGRTLYLHTPDGFGRSDLAAKLLNGTKAIGATGTARNWATVTKLLEMCG